MDKTVNGYNVPSPTLVLLLASILLTSCARSERPDVESQFCERQHVEETAEGSLAVCDELHSQGAPVRLPAREGDLAYGAVARDELGDGFATQDGAFFAAEFDETAQEAERLRHAVMIYELSLVDDRVQSYRPALQLDASVFVAPWLGAAAEGMISPRTAEGQWGDDQTLPVRIQFHTEYASEPEPRFAPELVASIANLDAAVTASDGTCLPALTSYGDESTFASGADIELRAVRHPSMHAFGDDVFVIEYLVDGETLGSMMGSDWYLGPIDLAHGPLEASGPYVGTAHSAPGALPNMDLEVVQGGGSPCVPT